MTLQVCKSESDWVQAINNWLSTQIAQTRARRIFLPAGETPKPLYKDWQLKQPAFLNGCTFVQLDEILTGSKRQEFQLFLKQSLPSYERQFEFIDQAEAGADIAILGLGHNGHVAFHEPGLATTFYSGCLILNSETAKRLNCEPETRVVSYGLGAFLRTRAIVLIVRGEAKRAILQNVLSGDKRLPAAHLLSHPNFHIITDFELPTG